MNLICKICRKSPDQLEEYQEMGALEAMTPDEFVWQEEGTLDKLTGEFYCTDCYIKAGQPILRRY